MFGYINLIKYGVTFVVILGAWLYIKSAFDTWHYKPVRECKAHLIEVEKNSTETVELLSETIRQAGVTITLKNKAIQDCEYDNRVNILNSYFDDIQDMEETGYEDTDDTFNIYKYSF